VAVTGLFWAHSDLGVSAEQFSYLTKLQYIGHYSKHYAVTQQRNIKFGWQLYRPQNFYNKKEILIMGICEEKMLSLIHNIQVFLWLRTYFACAYFIVCV
jgi:hypothetical protein